MWRPILLSHELAHLIHLISHVDILWKLHILLLIINFIGFAVQIYEEPLQLIALIQRFGGIFDDFRDVMKFALTTIFENFQNYGKAFLKKNEIFVKKKGYLDSQNLVGFHLKFVIIFYRSNDPACHSWRRNLLVEK